MVSAQSHTSYTFFVTTRRHDHGCTHGLGDLNRRHTNTTGTALNQQGFAFGQIGALKDIAPHSEEGFRQRCCFNIRQSSRYWQALPHRRNAQLRITAASDQSANTVTQPEAARSDCLCIARNNHAGHFQPRNIRGTWRHGVVTRPLQHIRPVDARSTDADQQLARTRHGRRPFSQPQHIGSTKSANFNSFHAFSDMFYAVRPMNSCVSSY